MAIITLSRIGTKSEILGKVMVNYVDLFIQMVINLSTLSVDPGDIVTHYVKMYEMLLSLFPWALAILQSRRHVVRVSSHYHHTTPLLSCSDTAIRCPATGSVPPTNLQPCCQSVTLNGNNNDHVLLDPSTYYTTIKKTAIASTSLAWSKPTRNRNLYPLNHSQSF